MFVRGIFWFFFDFLGTDDCWNRLKRATMASSSGDDPLGAGSPNITKLSWLLIVMFMITRYSVFFTAIRIVVACSHCCLLWSESVVIVLCITYGHGARARGHDTIILANFLRIVHLYAVCSCCAGACMHCANMPLLLRVCHNIIMNNVWSLCEARGVISLLTICVLCVYMHVLGRCMHEMCKY